MVRLPALIVLLLCMSYAMLGQKTFVLSMPEQNVHAFNVGYAGLEGSLDIAAWGREQWNNVPGAPSSQGLNAHLPMYALRGALGLRMLNDRTGPFHYQAIDIGYTYVRDRRGLIVSIGGSLGYQNIRFDGADLRTLDGVYTGGQIDHRDPSLVSSDLSAGMPVVSLGGYVINGPLEIGASLDRWSIGMGSLEDAPLGFDWAPQPSVHGYVTYGWDLSSVWLLQGHLHTLYDTYQVQSLVKATATYDDQWMLGLGWRGYHDRSLESIVTTVGYVVDRHLSLHYAYDIGLSGLAQASSGSHELIIRYNLDKRIGRSGPQVIGNPRVLD